MVLFPHGQPEGVEPCTSCAHQVLALGGDVHRMLEGPAGPPERFVEYLKRIRALVEGTEKAIVVLTRTHPLAWMVINTRRKLEQGLPALRGADWVIFVDPEADPFFDTTASTLGRFEQHDKLTRWIGPGGCSYLVFRRDRRRRTSPRPPKQPSPAP
jgi:hypothetical protein